MASFGEIMKHPDEWFPSMKVIWSIWDAEKEIHREQHWSFCYSILAKLTRSFRLVIHQLSPQLRDVLCIFYLVLRALDTVEDDMSIPTEVKVPILIAFHHHISDTDWHFSCGTKEYKVLMDEFHHVSIAFLELESSYRKIIEDVTLRMGAGMAKYICKEMETTDDYDEYCHHAAGLLGLGLSGLFRASRVEILATDSQSEAVGIFLQKTNIIRDYLEDINEGRTFWPHQIWIKYANELEDLQYEENAVKAIQCLNEMVTNALLHVEDCFKLMSCLRDPAIIRSCGIPQIIGIGTLALCYNNIQVFRGSVKMRRGLSAKVFDRTRTLSDFYGAFYDFSFILKSKVDNSDPNAIVTLNILEDIQKTCKESGILTGRKSYIIERKPSCNLALIVVFFTIIAVLFVNMTEKFANNL